MGYSTGMSDATATAAPRFFCYANGNGFCRLDSFSSKTSDLWVMGKTETRWVLAGQVFTSEWLAQNLGSRVWEFSPAGLLGGSVSAAKARASRSNGAKGGRPRKADK